MRPLTMAPLPKWGNILSALLNSPVADEALAAPWLRPGEDAFWFSRSAWSLAVVARWRQQLSIKKSVTVWIPDFFCNSSLKPLRDMGVCLVFYPVTQQLSPDVDACKTLADVHSPDLVVLVHYFGQPAPVEPMAAFCKEWGAWLVEDATHVLRPQPGIGETGDCIFYSPHKHLPISDGAVLVVRQAGPCRLAEQKRAMDVLREVSMAALNSPGYSNKLPIFWLLKRIFQCFGFRSRHLVVAFRAVAEPAVSEMAHPRMSALAKRLLSRMTDSLDEVACVREQRASDWRRTLAWANPVVALKSLPINTTPYLVGFSSDREVDAEMLFEQLQHAGLPITTWPDLPPEVMANALEHCPAIALRHKCFYLPVHQSLEQQQISAGGKNLLMATTAQWKAKILHREEWERYWQSCPKANLLQSWQYGAAKEEAEGWTAHRFLISNGVGQPVALTQVLIKGLPVIGGIARLNRGPLLLTDMSGDVEVSNRLAVLEVLLREARRQRWWLIQAAPELLAAHEARQGLQVLGFKKLPGAAWGSGRLALEVDEQVLLMNLNGKWRNCMRKGDKLGVTVTHHVCKGDMLELLMRNYAELQNNRGFDGLPEKLLRSLARQQGGLWQFNLFIARAIGDAPEEELGMLVTIRSGDSSIYLIGSTSDKGRLMQANSVLLWQSLLHAKHSGCAWFDIGGLNEATPKGIAEFKRGLNAVPYELVGEWRRQLLSEFF